MLHVPGAIVRWETPASVLFPLFTPNQPPVSGRRRSELLLWTNDIQSTRPNCLVHAEHEILIFLYFKPAKIQPAKPLRDNDGSQQQPIFTVSIWGTPNASFGISAPCRVFQQRRPHSNRTRTTPTTKITISVASR